MKLRTEYAVREELRRNNVMKKNRKHQTRGRTRRMAEVQSFTWELPREKKLKKSAAEKLAASLQKDLEKTHQQQEEEAKVEMGETKEGSSDSGLGNEEEDGLPALV
jgi:beta-lactamase class A